MFESSQPNNRVNAVQRILALLLSLFVHGLMILLLVVLPLLYFHILPQVDLLTILIAAPAPPPTPPPPPPPAGRAPATAARTRNVFVPGRFAPESLPKGIPEPDVEPPTVGVLDIGEGLTLGIPGGAGIVGSGIGSVPVGLLALPPIPPPPPPPPTRVRLPVGGNVQEAKLIRKVLPVYPNIPRIARISGDVSLEVMVDEEGNVSEVKVLKGHPALVEEAVRAVRQWKYSPTLLNGEPVPVTAVVIVTFRLN